MIATKAHSLRPLIVMLAALSVCAISVCPRDALADPSLAAAAPVSDDDFDDVASAEEAQVEEVAARFFVVRRQALDETLDFDRTVFGTTGSGAIAPARVKLALLAEIKVAALDLACGLTPDQRQKLRLAGDGDVKRLFDRIDAQRADWRAVVRSGPLAAQRELNELRGTVSLGPFQGQSLFNKTLDRTLTAEQRARCKDFGGIDRLADLIWIRASNDAAPTIREVRLTGTPFGDDGLTRIEPMTSLQILHMDSTRITDKGLRYLTRLNNLESLDLERTRIDGSGLAHLGQLQRLKVLNLAQTHVTDEALSHLQNLAGLKTLKLEATRIAGQGLKYLQALSQLEVLSVCDTRIGDDALAALAELNHLRELDLGATKITDAGLAHLAPLKNLHVLDLRRAQISDAGLGHLKGLASLRYVYLYGTQVTDSGIAGLQCSLPGAKFVR